MNLERALMVGAGGMLAHALQQVLQQRGVLPVALDHAHCDITQATSVQQALAAHRPQVVFNCAAYTRVDACESNEAAAEAVNATGVGTLAAACREAGTRLIHLSTDFVFDGASPKPYRPEDAPAPLSAYGRTKLHGEQLLREINPPGWIIARTAWLYGPHGASFPRTIVERARAGQPLRVVNDQWGSPTYTFDLAAALVNLVERQVSGLFHISNSGQTNWYEFAAATLEAFGVAAELSPTSTAEYIKSRQNQAHRPSYSVLECSSLVRATGEPMRPWREALGEFARRCGENFAGR